MAHGSAVTHPDAPPAVFVLPGPTPGSPPPEEGGPTGEWIEPLLQQNAAWFCRLRWLVVAALTAVGVASLFPPLLDSLELDLPAGGPLLAAGWLALLNLGFQHAVASSPAGRFPARLLLWTQIITDLLLLTLIVHWIGREWPAAAFMYLFHLILACIVFPARESLWVAVFAAGLHLASLSLSGPGILRHALPTFLVWIVIWYLVSRLADTLRRRDRDLALTNRRLEASSAERARHMLQTTHQLKAPFAAIHAQTQLLTGGYCGELPDAARTVIQRIATRCLTLARQIQEMLQLANLRSQGQNPPPQRPVQLDQTLEEISARLEPAARLRHIEIRRQLEPVRLVAAPDHLAMLLENLLVNAVNYSHDQGRVDVDCGPTSDGGATVRIGDHGIGIPPDKLSRIFDDYFRTDDAVRHNPASTGLGLAVVRQAAHALDARLRVESAPNQGTRVTVHFPPPPSPSTRNP